MPRSQPLHTDAPPDGSDSAPAAAPVRAEDVELLREAREGSRAAMEAFAQRMRCIPRALGALNHRRGTPLSTDDLADLAQEAFSVVWTKADTYRGHASLETWATRFAFLLFMNALRGKSRPRPRALDDVDEPPIDRESRGAFEHLFEALEGLDPDYARVIEMRDLDRLSFDQIAQVVGRPLGTVKNRYYRGIEKLRATLIARGEDLS